MIFSTGHVSEDKMIILWLREEYMSLRIRSELSTIDMTKHKRIDDTEDTVMGWDNNETE